MIDSANSDTALTRHLHKLIRSASPRAFLNPLADRLQSVFELPSHSVELLQFLFSLCSSVPRCVETPGFQ
jgi:hypothetical protein